MRAFSCLILMCFVSLLVKAQTPETPPDTMLMNNGGIVIAHITDTIGGTITIIKPHSRKHKKIDIDKEAIFSIKFGSTGKEEILYTYDTLVGHDYTVEEARKFIEGEQDAQRGFHAVGMSIMSFAIGATSGAAIGSLVAFGPPFIFIGLSTYPRIKVRHKSVKNLANGTSDAYLLGYDTTARRKRTLHTLLWGGLGLVSGLIFHFTVLTTQ